MSELPPHRGPANPETPAGASARLSMRRWRDSIGSRIGPLFERLASASGPSNGTDFDAALAREGTLETARRADRGILVHLPMWVVIATWGDLFRSAPLLFHTVCLLFFFVLAVRLVVLRRFEALVDRNRRVAETVCLALVLANSSLWGALSFLVISQPGLEAIKWQVLLAMAGITASSTIALSISNVVRWTAPLLSLGPVALGLLTDGTAVGVGMAFMCALSVAYLVAASRVIHDDYWSAALIRRELERRGDEFERLSVTDALTQLYNRRFFEQRLAEEWAHAKRTGASLAVLLLDIDHFKHVNDTHGHLVGDQCLKAVADALSRAQLRQGDVLARFGGEEFVVLLRDTNAASGHALAEHLRAGVAAIRLHNEGKAVPLHCSIGVASGVPTAQGSPAAMLRRADEALYGAKAAGRNRVVSA